MGEEPPSNIITMRIYRPMQTNYKTQAFGEDRVCSLIGVRPFVTRMRFNVTCPVGYESLYKSLGMNGHNGEDWSAYHGEPIYFPVEADTIWKAYTHVDADGGIGVDVISDDAVLDGRRVKFRFWHLKTVSVHDGMQVNLGTIIGFADSTGASTGDHLHWSMKFIDDEGNTLNRYNGYTGAVDFTPYFENVFVLDVLNVKAQAMTAINLANKVILELKVLLARYLA